MKFALAIVLNVTLVLQAFAADSRPNIVVFLADDLGWADVPWHGSPYQMPNLVKLAQQSVRLESHYVHPMCSPTRSALMTGRYASRFGVTGAQNPRCLPWNTVTLASALKSAVVTRHPPRRRLARHACTGWAGLLGPYRGDARARHPG